MVLTRSAAALAALTMADQLSGGSVGLWEGRTRNARRRNEEKTDDRNKAETKPRELIRSWIMMSGCSITSRHTYMGKSGRKTIIDSQTAVGFFSLFGMEECPFRSRVRRIHVPPHKRLWCGVVIPVFDHPRVYKLGRTDHIPPTSDLVSNPTRSRALCAATFGLRKRRRAVEAVPTPRSRCPLPRLGLFPAIVLLHRC